MTRVITDARLALIMVVWLFVVAGYSGPSYRCLWFQVVVIDGRGLSQAGIPAAITHD